MIPVVVLSLMIGQGPKSPTVVVSPRIEPTKPIQVSTALGRAVTLSADAAVQWESCDTSGVVELFPAADRKSCVVVASKPGRYIILAGAGNAPGAKIAVLVGDGANPDPMPRPPEPVPPPSDPLVAKMQAAFQADPLQLDFRRKAAENLVAVYTQAARVIEDPAITSISQHSEQVRRVSENLFTEDRIDPNSLAGVRRVLADELRAAFPGGPPTSLTTDVRQRIKVIYLRASEAIKKSI